MTGLAQKQKEKNFNIEIYVNGCNSSVALKMFRRTGKFGISASDFPTQERAGARFIPVDYHLRTNIR
ncbi:Uncharacterized protein dnm_077560 [Desulfonema magnum]|uniref:Uncharacterized protein n=1 Tax=Desulfonema magnum TaxID=45655 RepID=A0A975BUU4_9BACT|nr:Uncharacterized protein dnm_077560 [Desulfonema magnum]